MSFIPHKRNYSQYQGLYQYQIDRQKQEQAQDQMYSNETLCKLMTTLEGIFKRETNQNLHGGLFDYYDPTKSKEVKSLEELYTQANILIMFFSTSHKLYVQKYQKYDLPKNLDSTYLMDILNNMNISPKLRHLIENLKHILNQEYYKVIPIIEKSQRPTEPINFDYKTLTKDMPMIWANSHEVGKKVMQDYEKDPQGYAFQAQLNKDGSLNPLAQKQQIYSGLDFTQGPQGLRESYNLQQLERQNNPQNFTVNTYLKEKQNKDLGECKKSTHHLLTKCQCEQSTSSHFGDHHHSSNDKLDISAQSQRESKENLDYSHTINYQNTQTNHVNDLLNNTSMHLETSHDQMKNHLQNVSKYNAQYDFKSSNDKIIEENNYVLSKENYHNL